MEGFRELPELQHHNRNGYALCTACELRFAGTLLRLARDVMPLHDSLDATLHPGGHSPVRIQTATPPTPIRLDVLDLIDMLDATARELWHRLDGIDALDWRKDKRNEDLMATLIACAGHPKLATVADAGLYMHVINDLARKVDTVLDPPEQRREIGTCELCETMLTAGAADQWVTCPVCGREQRAQTVKLRRLKTLCWDDSERGSAADISKHSPSRGSRSAVRPSPRGSSAANCPVMRMDTPTATCTGCSSAPI